MTEKQINALYEIYKTSEGIERYHLEKLLLNLGLAYEKIELVDGFRLKTTILLNNEQAK